MVKSRMQEFLEDAQACGRLTNWEQNFVADMQALYDKFGERFTPSTKQRDVIDKIEAKIYA